MGFIDLKLFQLLSQDETGHIFWMCFEQWQKLEHYKLPLARIISMSPPGLTNKYYSWYLCPGFVLIWQSAADFRRRLHISLGDLAMSPKDTKRAFIFLNGNYHHDDSKLVRRLYRGITPRPLLVAVDGGLKFMQKINLKPRYWLTDLDSAPRIRKGFLKDTEILVHAPRKDKTDAELALDLCAAIGRKNLSFFGWYDIADETDHLLGNLMLVRLPTVVQNTITLRFLRSRQEIYYLKNQSQIFSSCRGRRLSVVPLSRKIVINLQGTQFPARHLTVGQGQTISLRNHITARRAMVSVGGAALVILAG